MSKPIDLCGMKFGKLTVVSKAETRLTPGGQKIPYWNCVCECGNTKVIRGTALKTGYTTSCGCHRKKFLSELKTENLVGQKFGKLTVLEYAGRGNNRHAEWKCLCECGCKTVVSATDLKSGHTSSCGCVGASRGENEIAELLMRYGVNFEREVSFGILVSSNGGLLRFDFCVKNDKGKIIALIEYQGEQHYMEKVGGFGDLQREETDDLKREFCKRFNVKLFEIRFDEDVEDRLQSIISELDLSHVNFVPSSDEEKV